MLLALTVAEIFGSKVKSKPAAEHVKLAIFKPCVKVIIEVFWRGGTRGSNVKC